MDKMHEWGTPVRTRPKKKNPLGEGVAMAKGKGSTDDYIIAVAL
jgi:hypothetical protein